MRLWLKLLLILFFDYLFNVVHNLLLYSVRYCMWIQLRKCLDHRSGFRHQIAGAPAAYYRYIAFFSLIRFKYATLTHQMRSPDSVVVSTLGCHTECWDTDSRWTRLANIALETERDISLHNFIFFL